MKKLLQSVIVSSMLLGGVHQGIAQTKTIKDTQKAGVEVLTNDHNYIINQSFCDIFQTYGREKGLDIIQEHMCKEINIYRAQKGLLPLAIDTSLFQAAKEHAQFLETHKSEYITNDLVILKDPHTQYFSNGQKKVLYERVSDQGFNSPFVQENIHIFLGTKLGQGTIQRAMDGWKHSPPHNQTLCDSTLTLVGVAVSGDMVVADFGQKDPKNRKRVYQK